MSVSLATSEAVKPVLGVFYPGETIGFLLVFILGLLIAYFVSQTRKGLPTPPIRKIAGLEAIDEAIGRATEMGRSVLYNIGTGGVSSPATLAALPILEYVTKTCAEYDTRLVNVVRSYVLYGVVDEVVKQTYVQVGKPEAYDPGSVRYFTEEAGAHVMAIAGFMQREKPAANIMMGDYDAGALAFAETGAVLGILQIAGTTNIAQTPFFVASCDYTLIGEELLAASAYISQSPILISSIVAQDYIKFAFTVLMIVGSVLAAFGQHGWLVKLFQY